EALDPAEVEVRSHAGLVSERSHELERGLGRLAGVTGGVVEDRLDHGAGPAGDEVLTAQDCLHRVVADGGVNAVRVFGDQVGAFAAQHHVAYGAGEVEA